MKPHTCPVCDHVYQDDWALAQHVLLAHLPTSDNGWLVCWCGFALRLKPPRVAGDYQASRHLVDHANRHGGITAHYNAVLLGID